MTFAFDAAADRPSAPIAFDLDPVVLDESALLSDPAAFMARPGPVDVLGKLAPTFEANQGQVDERVRYLSRGNHRTLYLTDRGAVLAWRERPPAQADAHNGADAYLAAGQPALPARRGALTMRLHGANDAARPTGMDRLATRSNYLIGKDPKAWRTNVPHYAKVGYRDVYPGIDLVFHGGQTRLEFDFVVSPGARVEDIQVEFEGAESLDIDAEGNLIAATGAGDVVIHSPLVYQPDDGHSEDGGRRLVDGAFVLGEDQRIGFQVASYDEARTLVIDPILTFSTLLGGSGSELTSESAGIVVDDDGMIYTAGRTASADFPTMDPFQANSGGGLDVFAAKLDPFTSSIVYATYIGGNAEEGIGGMDVDAAGSVVVVGSTNSLDFPVTGNAAQTIHGGGGNDAFAVRLGPTGSSAYYATYLGGNSNDQAQGVAIDALGNAYVTGFTSSDNYPSVNPAQANRGGGLDAFVTKLDPTGSEIVYSTFHGGTENELSFDAYVTPDGIFYASGSTLSSDLPLVNAIQTTYGGAGMMNFGDAFLVRLSQDGATRTYSTYIGGSGDDIGQGVSVDDQGFMLFGGATSSTDLTTVNALQPNHAGGLFDVFVGKLDPTGASFVYSTYYGGSGSDFGHGIESDRFGNIYVWGHTDSLDFLVVDAVQNTLGGGTDAQFFSLTTTGTAVRYATYLGGALEDRALHGFVDSKGNGYIAGDTESIDYPVANPVQGVLSGPFDAIVAKFETPLPQVLTSLVDNGASIGLGVSLANPNDDSISVAVRIWLESTVVAAPFKLTELPVNLPAFMPLTALINLNLPSALPFPGSLVGVRLQDPVTGEILSESLCATLPCN